MAPKRQSTCQDSAVQTAMVDRGFFKRYKNGFDHLSTEAVYDTIRELREELADLDVVIRQVEALAEDPPRRVRPRRADPTKIPVPNSRSQHARGGY